MLHSNNNKHLRKKVTWKEKGALVCEQLRQQASSSVTDKGILFRITWDVIRCL